MSYKINAISISVAKGMFYAIAILTKLEAVTSIITTSNEC
jgi:hypothetical protein